MNYLIIGASSGLGRELAYTFAESNNNLIISSRDAKDLNAIKSDLENKYKIKVKILPLDFSSTDNINSVLLSDKDLLETIDGVLFPVGSMLENDGADLDIKDSHSILQSNFLSITYTISKLTKYLNKKEDAFVVGFGSVSGYLGRKLNTNYAASKRALESYFESLAFKNKETKLKIQFYILGYIETNLSFGKNLNLPKGSPSRLAKIVYKNRKAKFKKKHFPLWWAPITLILKAIPINILLKISNIFE